ncbi:hypothetical protein ScPMuIL_013808 [Solemya velum]
MPNKTHRTYSIMFLTSVNERSQQKIPTQCTSKETSSNKIWPRYLVLTTQTIAVTGLVVTTGVAAYSTYKYLTLKSYLHGRDSDSGHSHDEGHGHSHDGGGEGGDFGGYEDSKNSFMSLHYATANEVMRYSFIPKDAIEFPRRAADICIKYFGDSEKSGVPSRVMDVGCCVGRISFELTRGFKEVVGLDYMRGFVDLCKELQRFGVANYTATEEAEIKTTHAARVPSNLERDKVTFVQGDACNLSDDLGQFGCVLAANLVCRVPKPMAFLKKVPDVLAANGILVIMDHYSWDEMDTEKSEWLGGFYKDMKPVMSSSVLKSTLSENFELLDSTDIPLICTFSARTYFYMVVEVTVWKKKTK